MGFSKKIETETGTVGIWELTETSGELIKNFSFSEQESIRFSMLKAERRQREFLAVRLLLQQILGTKTELYYGNLGNPHLKDNDLNISISHSAELAAIFISKKNCGIDTENINRDTQKIASRFLTDEELETTMKNRKPGLARIIYWSAKEAIYKCALERRVLFNSHIIIQPLKIGSEGSFSGRLDSPQKSASYNLNYFFFGNNVIVYGVEV